MARAFTCYFHLANLAEEHHRARVLRERDHGPEPLPESLAATTRQLSRQLGRRRMQELVKGLEVHPVFTAHPTEARRRAVVTAIRRVGDQLDRVNDPTASTNSLRKFFGLFAANASPRCDENEPDSIRAARPASPPREP